MSLRSRLLLSALVPALVFSAAASADGTLDPAFGVDGNGRVVSPFDVGSPPNDTLVDLVMDGDERLYLVGQVRDADDRTQLGLARLQTNGQLDPTFGVLGQRVAPYSQDRLVMAAAFGSDRNLLVAAQRLNGTSSSFSVCNHDRNTGNTTLLPGGNTACVDYAPIPDRPNTVRDIVVQPDGKIVLLGSSLNLANKAVATVMRLNADGSKDLTFSGDGQITLDLGDITQLSAGAWDAYQEDGLVLCGTVRMPNLTHNDMLVARLSAQTGELDAAFSGDGWANYDFDLATYSEICNAVTVDRIGQIHLAGSASSGGQSRGAALRVAPTTGFVIQQFGRTILSTGDSYSLSDIQLRADGTTIVAGTRTQAGLTDWHVRALNSSGQPVITFGSGGSRTIDFALPGQNEYVAGLALQNGRVVVAGPVLAGGASTFDFGVARLDGDVIFANSFVP